MMHRAYETKHKREIYIHNILRHVVMCSWNVSSLSGWIW